MTNPLVAKITAGARVTFTNRFGQPQTGRAVMLGPAGWVLNMGGAHGTPAVPAEATITKVVPPKAPKTWAKI